jgi:hypothetical protein
MASIFILAARLWQGKGYWKVGAYIRASRAANITADDDSDKRWRATIEGIAKRSKSRWGPKPQSSVSWRPYSRAHFATQSECGNLRLQQPLHVHDPSPD